ncbi:hypothetical protein [Pseudomonas sp. MWU13-3659]|uniref:hypothetical protein n=1 Tax=Pseudomonas sp. MWU13-3659 TaxID=2986964 RepID=UPI002075A0C6|nr:hypothetical protein [Pseudomonas sp. MWU13-3659]
MPSIQTVSSQTIGHLPIDVEKSKVNFVPVPRTAGNLAQRFVDFISGILRSLKALFVKPKPSTLNSVVNTPVSPSASASKTVLKAFMAIDLESDGKHPIEAMAEAVSAKGSLTNFLNVLQGVEVTGTCSEKIQDLFSSALSPDISPITFGGLFLPESAMEEALAALSSKQLSELSDRIVDAANDIYMLIKADESVIGADKCCLPLLK